MENDLNKQIESKELYFKDLALQQKQKIIEQEKREMEFKFEEAIKLLERKEKIIEWRNNRVALDLKRRQAILAEWSEEEIYHFQSNKVVLVIPEQPESHLDIHSTQIKIEALQPEDKIGSERIEEVCNMEQSRCYSENSVFEESILLDEPLELSDHESEIAVGKLIDKQSIESMQEISNEQVTPIKTEISLEEASNESSDYSILSFPRGHFGISLLHNKTRKENESIEMQLESIYMSLKNRSERLIPIRQAATNSFLKLWSTVMNMLSTATISSLFTSLGKSDINDIRFHFDVLKSFFLFGSGHFVSLVSDRLFDSNGIDINSRLSNIVACNYSEYFSDIFENVCNSSGELFDYQIKNFLDVDSFVNQYGMDLIKSFRIIYKVPAPFDSIITQTELNHYNQIFTLLLTIFQAKNAYSKIHGSSRWKSLNNPENSSQSKIIIHFMQQTGQFLNGLQNYTFHYAISTSWFKFTKQLEQIATECNILTHEFINQYTVDSLINLHSESIDEIKTKLLFNNLKLYESIEEYLFLIIKFSRSMQDLPSDSIELIHCEGNTRYKRIKQMINDEISRNKSLHETRYLTELLDHIVGKY
jgi:hypothetical protein